MLKVACECKEKVHHELLMRIKYTLINILLRVLKGQGGALPLD